MFRDLSAVFIYAISSVANCNQSWLCRVLMILRADVIRSSTPLRERLIFQAPRAPLKSHSGIVCVFPAQLFLGSTVEGNTRLFFFRCLLKLPAELSLGDEGLEDLMSRRFPPGFVTDGPSAFWRPVSRSLATVNGNESKSSHSHRPRHRLSVSTVAEY